MAIRKITPRSILSGALTENLNIDSGTLYVDTSANRVGIVTTSPTTALSVVGSANITSTSSNSFKVRNTVAGTSALSQISIGNDTDVDLLYMQAFSTTYTTAGVAIQNGAVINGEGVGGLNLAATQAPIRFFSGGDTERMRLDSNGHLGLGVTPSATWSLGGGKALQLPSGSLLSYSTTDLHIAQNSFYNGSNWVYTNTGTATLNSQLSGEFRWSSVDSGSAGSTASFTRRMTLSAAGKLGLGNSNPSQLLHLEVSSGDIYQQIQSGANLVYVGYEASRDVGVIQSNNALTFDMGNSYVERMRLDTSGNLGLGVTPSTWSLFKAIEIGAVGNSIVGRSGSSTLAMGANWTYNSGFKYANTGASAQYEITGAAHYWYNAPSGTATNPITFTQAMTLTASGNLGVGTTSPAAFTGFTTNRTVVQIANNASDSGQIILGGATNALLLDYNNSLGDVTIRNTYGASAAGALINIDSGTLAFRTGTSYTERMRIDSSGNVGIGVTPSAWRTTDRALEIGSVGKGLSAPTSSNSVFLATNWYVSTAPANVYAANGYASRYAQSDGTHIWSTAPSNSSGAGASLTFAEGMRLDASGNLLVGTTTTVSKTTIFGTGNQFVSVISNTGGATQVGINLNPSMTAAEAATNPAQAAIYAVDSSYSANIIFANKATGAIGNSLTERMRIDSSGNLLVGTTSNAANSRMAVSSSGITIYDTGYRQIYMNGNVLSFFNGSNEATLTNAGVWTNASDSRLKKNITNIKYGLNTVLITQPRSFERNDVEGNYIGFIAQELKEHIPEVVYGEKQLSVDYGSLVAVAFKAIQEQQALIESLTTRLTALENK
jgi:hypothetical protein